ncbi:MAG: hypothetical protein F9B45_25490 [Phycisphaera sp. RhM]|nr:hypothetical protein [Phycisphaera sp. RhM]
MLPRQWPSPRPIRRRRPLRRRRLTRQPFHRKRRLRLPCWRPSPRHRLPSPAGPFPWISRPSRR